MKSAKLIYNPKAGEGADPTQNIIAILKKAGYECSLSSTKEEGWEKLDAKETDLIIVAGGDGTVRKVAFEFLDKRLPLGLLPLGTANNIAKTLELEEEPEDIIAQWDLKKIKRFDVGRIYNLKDQKFFIEGLGFGVFPRLMKEMQKITPFLWFDDKADEAANFYVSLFKNSKITGTTRYDEKAAEASGRPKGTVMTVEFQLEGQEYVALNGGPHFKFTEAVSFVVNCETQDEVDKFWEKLSEGGEKSQCGWLKDRYGLSWQVVPTVLSEMLTDRDPVRAKRVMEAMLKMRKLDIQTLKQAYDQN